MTIRLELVKETDSARLYRTKDGREFWLPRSIINRTLKWPNGVHEVDIPDWKAKELEL